MMGITDILTFPVFGRSGFGVWGFWTFGVRTFGVRGFWTFGVRTFGAPFRTFGVFGPPKKNPERPKSYFRTFGVGG